MSIEISLEGKVAAVTGAGRGIGKDVALTLARAGANIWAGDIDEDNIKQLVKEVEELGVKCGYGLVDVSNPEQVEGWMDGAEKFGNGKLDILVNVAGIVDTTPFMATTPQQAKKVLDVNTLGTFYTLQAAIKRMMPHNDGKIVTLSSVAGRHAAGSLDLYCASKAACISLTQSAALASAAHGINVNSIAPGILRTPMWEKILDSMAPDDSMRDATFDGVIKSAIPQGKPQTTPAIADAVLFLVSDLAREITGQTLNVDGGMCLN